MFIHWKYHIFMFLSPLGSTPIDDTTLSLNAKSYNEEDSELLYIPDYELT